MFAVCVSLVSLRCWVAMVEVLNRMRSKRLSALVLGWEGKVSVIMALTLEQACVPGLQQCRVYKIPRYRKLNFAAFVTGVFQFSVQEFVKILLWVSDSII